MTRARLFLFDLLKRSGVDEAISLAVMGNIVSLLIGPITVVLIASRFSPTLQGFYYTFGSLTSLQYIIELGLGQAIIQFASHEWAFLSFGDDFRFKGNDLALSKLVSLGRISFKWYSLAGIFAVLLLGVIGFLLFGRTSSHSIAWKAPWLLICATLGLNLIMMPAFYLLQGCNQIVPFWRYRLIQQVINGLVLWICILSGARLWTQPIAAAAGIVWSIAFLVRYKGFLNNFKERPRLKRISWLKDVWPIQWRIGASWISTNFTSQIFTPILFWYSGPIVAGQVGMTITLVNVLIAISANWVITQAPQYGILIAKGEWAELDKKFFRAMRSSIIVSIILAIISGGLVILLGLIKTSLAQRILPVVPAGLFLSSAIFSSALISLAVYLRAHKEEPLVPVFLGGSAIILAFSLLVADNYGAVGVGIGYLAILSIFELPLSWRIFSRCRASWHQSTTKKGGCSLL